MQQMCVRNAAVKTRHPKKEPKSQPLPTTKYFINMKNLGHEWLHDFMYTDL